MFDSALELIESFAVILLFDLHNYFVSHTFSPLTPVFTDEEKSLRDPAS